MTGDAQGDPPPTVCPLTGRPVPPARRVRLADLRPGIARLVMEDHPGAGPETVVDRSAVADYRVRYVESLLKAERGELGSLDRDVLDSLARQEMVTRNIDDDRDRGRSVGEMLADNVASFGGSWTFILLFAALLALWMTFNALRDGAAFDPYPFILLNLVLSCLAAIQAPIIMMSQGRQEAKDRRRSENDYRVNLKAELEIRHLHEKIDHLLTHQWERLAEIQATQINLLSDLRKGRDGEAS